MWKHRTVRKMRQRHESHVGIMGMRNAPPYGLVEDTEPIDALLQNADIYTLENIKNNPELMKPLNCTVLAPNGFDVVETLEKVVDYQTKIDKQNNEPQNVE